MLGGDKKRAGALALAGIVIGAGALAGAGSGAGATPGCGAFKAQGDAQDAFVEAGGTPRRNVAKMDADRDGVACEGLPAPYKGYATIGYNRKKQFFYGTATMPPSGTGAAEIPCLYGNRHFHDAPRKVNVFRVTADGDKPLLGEYRGAAEAQPETGRLIWKAEKAHPLRGLYYATFEERIHTTPYGRNECPAFSTQPTLLPRPRD